MALGRLRLGKQKQLRDVARLPAEALPLRLRALEETMTVRTWNGEREINLGEAARAAAATAMVVAFAGMFLLVMSQIATVLS